MLGAASDVCQSPYIIATSTNRSKQGRMSLDAIITRRQYESYR